MIGAVVVDNIVKHVIVLRESQKAELEKSLSCEIIDARPYGLIAGDLRTANGWTRNAGGEQMILQPTAQEDYNTYSVQTRQIIALKEAQPAIREEGIQDAIDILTGVAEAQEVVEK